MTIRNKYLFMAIFLFSCAINAFAGRTTFETLPKTVSVDLPEDFILEASEGNSSFQLANTTVPVKAIVRIFEKEKYQSPAQALETILKNLGISTSIKDVKWQSQKCALAQAEGSISQRKSKLIACAAKIPENESIILLFTWCDVVKARDCTAFMESFIDSLCISNESYFTPGLYTESLYPTEGKTQKINMDILGTKLTTEMEENALEASEYCIDREYKTLCLYMKSSAWIQAWQRYYRMIFRDSCGRLSRACFDITNALAPSCKDETDLAQKLLTWVQGFGYERQKNAADFASLPSILLGGGSDCDSRSMLLCVLLQSANQDAIMFVSREYQHAIAGFISSHPGFSFEVSGKKYLTGETTAKNINWGNISQTQSDQKKWIPVQLP